MEDGGLEGEQNIITSRSTKGQEEAPEEGTLDARVLPQSADNLSKKMVRSRTEDCIRIRDRRRHL